MLKSSLLRVLYLGVAAILFWSEMLMAQALQAPAASLKKGERVSRSSLFCLRRVFPQQRRQRNAPGDQKLIRSAN